MEEIEETEPSSTSATEYLSVLPEESPSEELPSEEEELPPEIDISTDNDNTPHIYGGSPHIIYNPELNFIKPPDTVKPPDKGGLLPHVDGLPPDLHYNYPNIKKLDTDVRPPLTGSFPPVVPPIPALPPVNDSTSNQYIRYLTRKLG